VRIFAKKFSARTDKNEGMVERMRRGVRPAICIGLCIATFATTVRAQDAPPPAYPPQQYPPPVQPYGQQPPPGYNPYPAAPPPPPVAGPWKMPYEDGQPIPPGYRVEERVRTGAIVGGALALGIPYLIGLTIASADNFQDNTRWLMVPVAGPWLLIGATKDSSCAADTVCVDQGFNTVVRFYLALDGIAQAAGTVLLIWGLHGRKILVRDGFASNIFVAPQITAQGGGAVVGGRF
jgi:hypothetical protein